jgi:hypothetical protein
MPRRPSGQQNELDCNCKETLMTQAGTIVGTVEFRPGDGAMMRIPQGPVDIDMNRLEATLSWVDGETHGAAAMPLTEFKRYVSKGAIALA